MRILTTLIAGLLVGGCGGAAATAPAHGWVTGLALTGRPLCPTPTAQESLCHPAPRAHAVVTVTGRAGTRHVLAGRNGRFRVSLPPGRYVIRSGAARPVSVRVVAGRVARVRMRLSILHAHG